MTEIHKMFIPDSKRPIGILVTMEEHSSSIPVRKEDQNITGGHSSDFVSHGVERYIM